MEDALVAGLTKRPLTKRPSTLDQLIRAYIDSAGRGLSILRGTVRFGRGAEYDALCEMFRNRVPCVEPVYCAARTVQSEPRRCANGLPYLPPGDEQGPQSWHGVVAQSRSHPPLVTKHQPSR